LITSSNLKVTASKSDDLADPIEIPFEVPLNGIMKSLVLNLSTIWQDAIRAIAEKMNRDSTRLSLGYINPFKPRASGKPTPNSLDNEDEWNGLVEHVTTYLKDQKAKNKGKGGAIKRFVFELVNLSTPKV
jgi:hypothetical protein